MVVDDFMIVSVRPKENEMVRDQLEKAIQLIWDCRIPSPRCVAIDAVVECDLVSTLGVSVFPELIFTKTGRILHREKGTNNMISRCISSVQENLDK
ncbi:hypothetical protein Hanom_Chr06g00570761 [Helianthus anomalus]